jgi:hypothetical protein
MSVEASRTLNILDTTDPAPPNSGSHRIMEGGCPETGHSSARYFTTAVMEWDYSNGFKNFNKLPGELRNMIWELVLPEGRLIRIISRTYQKGCQNALTAKAWAEFDDIPILQVCRESRSLASKYFPMCFKRQLVRPFMLIWPKTLSASPILVACLRSSPALNQMI